MTTQSLRARIKLARKSAGLTQRKLAELSGVSQNRISQYETGARDITTATADRLLSALDKAASRGCPQ